MATYTYKQHDPKQQKNEAHCCHSIIDIAPALPYFGKS